jgi:hypothetical protein
MKLIDMKNTVKTKDSSLVSPVEQAEYPYGLRISLNNDSLKKLGITELPAIDSEHKLIALVCVVGLTMNESAGEGEPYRSVDLQIEQLALMPAKEEDDESGSDDDRAKAMYPTMLG